ncbi:MAG: hypothetical protein R3C05_04320 [Pirellulaceae bacterium]
MSKPELLRKLSDLETLPLDDRAYWLALSLVLEPGQPQIAVQASNFVWNVEDIELVEQELLSSSQGCAISDDAIETLNREDFDVPVRFGFQVASRDIADVKTLDELARSEELPYVISSVFLSGKQTDRPAQLRALGVASVDRERFLTFVSSLTSLSGEPELEDTELDLIGSTRPLLPMMRQFVPNSDTMKILDRLMDRHFVERVMASSMKLLDNQTLSDVVDDESTVVKRMAVYQVVESFDLSHSIPSILPQLLDALKIAARPAVTPTSDEEIPRLKIVDLYRLDESELTFEQTLFALHKLDTFRCRSSVIRFANRIVQFEATDEQMDGIELGYACLVKAADTPELIMENLDRTRQWYQRHDKNYSMPLLAAAIRLVGLGDIPRVWEIIQETSSTYRNDPEVMSTVHQLLVQLGIMNPDGSVRSNAAPPVANFEAGMETAATSAASGLWTPDAPQPSQPGTGGKLWIWRCLTLSDHVAGLTEIHWQDIRRVVRYEVIHFI